MNITFEKHCDVLREALKEGFKLASIDESIMTTAIFRKMRNKDGDDVVLVEFMHPIEEYMKHPMQFLTSSVSEETGKIDVYFDVKSIPPEEVKKAIDWYKKTSVFSFAGFFKMYYLSKEKLLRFSMKKYVIDTIDGFEKTTKFLFGKMSDDWFVRTLSPIIKLFDYYSV